MAAFYNGDLIGGTATPVPNVLPYKFDEPMGVRILQFNRKERWPKERQRPVRGP